MKRSRKRSSLPASERIGIIGGSGSSYFKIFKDFKKRKIQTKYGKTVVWEGRLGNKNIVFLPRHKEDYSLAPSAINCRANVLALKILKVKYILALCCVGSLDQRIKPGYFFVITDFLDFTKKRVSTFFDKRPIFTDMTDAYSPFLNKIILKAVKPGKANVFKGVYVCTEGPRFETQAEIKMFRKLGADVVGMTSVPEVVLAKEIGLEYASLALVTNYACGIKNARPSANEVEEIFKKKTGELEKIILRFIELL